MTIHIHYEWRPRLFQVATYDACPGSVAMREASQQNRGTYNNPRCGEDTTLHWARFPAFSHGKVRALVPGRPASTGGRGEVS
jgi:hypothetical protein